MCGVSTRETIRYITYYEPINIWLDLVQKLQVEAL
jgi:hypothetical protein